MKRIILMTALLWPVAISAQDHTAHSAYAGLETREIKTLSDADLDDLRRVRDGDWPCRLS